MTSIKQIELAHQAIINNNLEDIVTFFTGIHEDEYHCYDYMLIEAAGEGKHEVIELLLSYGLNPNYRNLRAYQTACDYEMVEVINVFLSNSSFNPLRNTCSEIINAFLSNNPNTLKTLFNNKKIHDYMKTEKGYFYNRIAKKILEIKVNGF